LKPAQRLVMNDGQKGSLNFVFLKEDYKATQEKRYNLLFTGAVAKSININFSIICKTDNGCSMDSTIETPISALHQNDLAKFAV
jgi:hypothetical protein